MSTHLAKITPQVATWARLRMDLSVEMIATKMGVKAEQIKLWEEAIAHPTFRQAQALAHVLNIPFGYLFLPAPPKLTTQIPDLRTVGGRPTSNVSIDFLDLLHDVILKQQWYGEYVIGEGKKPLDFVGRCNISQATVEEVAEDVAGALSVNARLREESPSWGDFLRRLILNAERLGVLVMRSGVVRGNNTRTLSVDEFRGFAIPDVFAPLIFINSRDAETAQIFTFFHEIAHIWLGEGGISNPDFTVKSSAQRNKIERFCDKVAVEVLVPQEELNNQWSEHEQIDDNLRNLARYFRVSSFVVLRRAFNLNLISEREYGARLKKHLYRRAHEKDGGDFYATLRARNSNALTNAVVGEALEGRMLLRDAARLLNVKVPLLEKVSEGMARTRSA